MRLSSELEINLGRLKENFFLLRKLAPQNKVIFMVKSNAYGHGLLPIVTYSETELDIDSYGFASLGEALEVRTKLPFVKGRLLVFSDTQLQNKEIRALYLEHNIIPIISNLVDLKTILNDQDFKYVPLFLKFNTGMNRLGISCDECEETISLLKQAKRNEIEHLLTHFSSSYIPLKENDRTNKQYQKFSSLKKEFKDNGIAIKETSVSNSGAIEQQFGLNETHIRPGLMLYGAKSHPKSSWHGKCISSLKTEIIKIAPVLKGTPVGYGAHICGEEGYLVYLALGYGDGILTYYSGKKMTLHYFPTKILGRVNMDITTLFFKNLPKDIEMGGSFYFWDGSKSDISELAFDLGTTPYQVFTAITSRVPRRYLN